MAQLSTGAGRGPKSAHGPKIEREGYLKNALNIDKKFQPPAAGQTGAEPRMDRQTDRLLEGPRPSQLLGSEQVHVIPGLGTVPRRSTTAPRALRKRMTKIIVPAGAPRVSVPPEEERQWARGLHCPLESSPLATRLIEPP